MRMRKLAWLFAAALSASAAHASDNVRIAFIDPLSGPFANIGESELRHFQMIAEMINARGGVLGRKLEIVPMDNKTSPQDSVLQLKSAIDQGIHYITQGNGSNVAHALVDTLDKHNKRNPDQAVLYLNYAAVDPALTNEKCTFFHFRFDADADMKMAGIVEAITENKAVSKVYLLNQDYAFGQAVSRAAKAMLPKRRPDIQIVGDDLHPLGKVKDFAPYVSKIRSAGADVVLTGNWGQDLSLLVKASKEAGLDAVFYTLNAHNAGIPGSLGKAGAEHVRQVVGWHANVANNKLEKTAADYRKRFGEDYWLYWPKLQIDMVAKAIDTAKSADPLKVAHALHGMKFESATGAVEMRAIDHQLVAPEYIATFTKTGGAAKYDAEGTGYGWKTDVRIEAKDVAPPTTCRMSVPK